MTLTITIVQALGFLSACCAIVAVDLAITGRKGKAQS